MSINLSGLRVTVMGLGVHGGGLAATRYAVARGAEVTVTDLRDKDTLKTSLDGLPDRCRVVLGRHDERDFTAADLIIKNPAVPRTVAFLQHPRAITSDIALFLAEWRELNDITESPGHAAHRQDADTAPLLVGVTGTKGKSTCTSLTAHLLRGHYPRTRIGGNITISPLAFLDDLQPGDPLVLELSSFQLGDLAFFRSHNGQPGVSLPSVLPGDALFPTLPATTAIITNIFHDHQDYYSSMERYVADKREIYAHLSAGSTVIFSGGNDWTPSFLEDLHRIESPAQPVLVGPENRMNLPEPLPIPGRHNRINIEMAVHAAAHSGVPEETVKRRLASFPGVPHRLQTVSRTGGIRFVNDTTATIPEAAREAVTAFAEDPTTGALFLLAGGSDKGLDPGPLLEAFRAVIATGGAIALLEGSATSRLWAVLSEVPQNRIRSFSSLSEAMAWLIKLAESTSFPDRTGTENVILLSPGCASFGMFKNEFDRGEQFVRLAVESDRG